MLGGGESALILIALAGGSSAERKKIAEVLVSGGGGGIVAHDQGDRPGLSPSRRCALIDEVLWDRRSVGLVLVHCLVSGEADRVRACGGLVWHLYSTPSLNVAIRQGDPIVSLCADVPAHVLTPLEAYSEQVLVMRRGAGGQAVSSTVFRILPQYAYGNPAQIVEVDQLRSLGCSACARSELVFGIPVCKKSLRFPACRSESNGYQLKPEAGGQ